MADGKKRRQQRRSSVTVVAFSNTIHLENAFESLCKELGTETIEISRLGEFFQRADLKVGNDELEDIMRIFEFEIEHRGRTGRLIFEDILRLLTKPQYSFPLTMAEEMSHERQVTVAHYIAVLLGSDLEARKLMLKEPPTVMRGDKQACRLIGLEMHNQRHDEDIRIMLARAITTLAEKPRLVSGEVAAPGEKALKLYDNKSMAAYMHCLRLSKHPAYLDKRSLWNPEDTNDPNNMISLVEVYKAWKKKSTEIRRPPVYLDEIPVNDPLSKPEFFLEFRYAVNEPSDGVRVAAVESLISITDHEHEQAMKVLMHTAIHDPGFTVRAAAVQMLGNVAREIRKEGYSQRLGDYERWWDENEYPFRTKEESIAFFWSVLEQACVDPAWQVRKRAVETIADAVSHGDVKPFGWVAARVEDACLAVRKSAMKMLISATFGRGSFISERNHRVSEMVQAGVPPHEASVRADQETAEVKEVDWDRAALDALVLRTRHPQAMQRRSALQALGDVMSGARVHGDRACIEAFLRVLEEGGETDELVQNAAIGALWKCTLKGDSTVVLPIAEFALRQRGWQSRKTAIEALERISGAADARVVATLVQMLDDKEASVREAVVRALEVIAPERDPVTLNAVAARLQDTSWAVRRGAARTLTMVEPEGERQESVAGKVFGLDDKRWYNNVQGLLMKPLQMPLR